MEQGLDPVTAIKLAENMLKMSVELKDLTPGMEMTMLTPSGPRQSHPLDDIEEILDRCKASLYSKYGEMMWETPDGPIDIREERPVVRKSQRQEHLPAVSSKVLPQVRTETGTNPDSKAISYGVSVLGRARTVEGSGSDSVVRRLLGKVTRRKNEGPRA